MALTKLCITALICAAAAEPVETGRRRLQPAYEPTKKPTSRTDSVYAPTYKPTRLPTSGARCRDNPDWKDDAGEKGQKGCDHVASEPDKVVKRCVNRKSDDGVWAYEACPKTCGTCGTPCDRPGISTSRGAATFDCAYFRDSDGGNHPTMTVDNICKFQGGTRIQGAPNTQPKDSFRIPIYHGEQAYKSRPMDECETGKPEEGGKRSCTEVTRNGVTFWLNTYVGNVENVNEEPVYEAYSDSQPFACTFP